MIVELKNKLWAEPLKSGLTNKIIEDLEKGSVIFMPSLNFSLTAEEEKFLTPQCADPKSKNINYHPQTSVLRGSICTEEDLVHLQAMMSRYATNARQLIESLFPHYKDTLKWGRTSYRPIEVEGRKVSSYRKDDTRLHVDSFAATPIQGQRLLRVFTNINPHAPRVWKLGEPFETVANHFLPRISHKQWISPILLNKLGITKGIRSLYDHLMLQIHDGMKRDLQYQHTASQQQVSFPAGSTWIVMTDQVSHAALAGQYMMEQTFYLDPKDMKMPEHAPLSVLERLTGKNLI